MANNGGHYDPRAQAMEEVHFDWRCIVCCMVALSPLHLEQQHLPGTESVYFDLDNTPWVKCDKCHTPFHLQCGTWESVYVVRSRPFLCTFFVVGSSNFSSPLLIYRSIYSFSFPCRLKMAQKPHCPDTLKDKKKKPKPPSSRDCGGSTHVKQKIGLFQVEVMMKCIAEIHKVEADAKRHEKKPKSRNKICEEFGLSPSTVSKRMTRKVKSMGPALGGPRRGKVFTAGRFQAA